MEAITLSLNPRTVLRGEAMRRRYLDNYRRRLRRVNPAAEIDLRWKGDRVTAVIGGISEQEALRKWY